MCINYHSKYDENISFITLLSHNSDLYKIHKYFFYDRKNDNIANYKAIFIYINYYFFINPSKRYWNILNIFIRQLRVSKLGKSLILRVITRDRRFFRGGLSRRMDNRRRKEFFTPLFLTPGALWRRKSAKRKARRVWPRAGHGWVILISGLHTPLGRLDDYFGSGAGQYLDNTLTSGFVRSVSTTTPHASLFLSCPVFQPPPRSFALEHQRMLSKADFYPCYCSLWCYKRTRKSY